MKAQLIALAGVLLVAVLAYQGVRQNGWVYEDRAMQIVAEGDPGLSVGIMSRNASRLSVYGPARVFGPSPLVQHVVNLLLHLVNGALLWLLLRAVVAGWPAVVGTALFLWAPIQVETAAYVASRPDLLMVTGLLLASLGAWSIPVPDGVPRRWTRDDVGRYGWPWLLLIVGVVLAVSAKQTGILVAPWLCLLRWARDPARRLGWGATLLGVLAAGSTLAWTVPPDLAPLPYTRVGTMAYQSAAFFRMGSLVVWPQGFTIDHNIGMTPIPLAWLALAGVGGLVLVALAVRKTHPLVTLACGWMLLPLSPRFLISLPEYLNEHQYHMAVIAWGLLLALGVEQLRKAQTHELSAPAPALSA